MKKILRRLIVSMLTISLVFAYLPVWASADVSEARFQTEALGIFDKESDGTTDWDKQITRAEFAHAIAKLIRQDSDGLSYSLKDVNVATPYSQDIYAMLLLGIMNGDGNGYFRPMDHVSATEAATVFLRLIGYSHVINNGAYPETVINWGVKTKLLDNVSLYGKFTRSEFAVMLYNAFDIKLMETSLFTGSGSEYHISDITFGDVIFSDGDGEGYYYGKGIVMQNAMSFVDVPYTTLENDEIVIGSTIYRVGKTNAAELLGMEVQFYAKKLPDGVYEIQSVTPTDKNKIKRVDATDFVDYEHKSSFTYMENNKKQKVTLEATASLIKNFDTVSVPTDEIFAFDSGEYVLISNDSDNKTDVVLAYSYENAVVSGVYNDVITVKEGFSINGTRYLNLDKESDEILFSVVDKNGNYVDINTLSNGSVISVATDRTGKMLRVIVREDAKQRGTLESVSEDGFEFNGVIYNVFYNDDYSFGVNYDYYLNFKDDIVFYELSPDETVKKYGYVIAVDSHHSNNQIEIVVSKQVDFGIEINDEDADNVTQIPMLICQNEEVAIYDMADKVKFNGEKVKSSEVQALVENSSGLFEFELDSDGKLAKLTEAEYKAGSQYATFKYDVYDKCFGGASGGLEGFAINENSQILCIPTNADPTEDDYMVKNVINIEGNTLGYYVRGFDYNPNTKKCDLIVINREMKSDNIPGVTINSSKVSIVKSIRNVLNSDDEYVTEIEFVIGKEEKKLPLSEAAMEVVQSLEKGDLFVYEENYEGEITNLKKIRSVSDLSNDFNQSSSLSAGASELCGTVNEILFDEIDSINTRLVFKLIVDVDGTLVAQQVPQRNKPPIYMYDADGEVSAASVEDIVPGSDKVYVFMKSSTVTAALLIVRQ